MHLSKDLSEFVELLNSNEVECVIVGAFAVARGDEGSAPAWVRVAEFVLQSVDSIKKDRG